MDTRLVGRTLDQSIMHCWGQRSSRGQPGSTTGQLLRNIPWPPNFVGRTPDYALIGLKVMQGLAKKKIAFSIGLYREVLKLQTPCTKGLP